VTLGVPARDRARIDDFADPRWTDEARPYVDGLSAYGEQLGLDALTPDRVRSAAAEQTGLDTWGDEGDPADGESFAFRFDLLCRALREEVRRIYAVADQPLDDRSLAAMWAFTAAHPRGRHGTIFYDLDALGIDATSRRTALAEYSARYGLRDEGL
jgi:hypothetical protein